MAGRAAPRDFLRAEPEENPEEQSYQPEENSVLPESFTQIYILLLIGFLTGPPKMHGRFRIGSPYSVLALLKCMDGSVLALITFTTIFSHQNSTDWEFC